MWQTNSRQLDWRDRELVLVNSEKLSQMMALTIREESKSGRFTPREKLFVMAVESGYISPDVPNPGELLAAYLDKLVFEYNEIAFMTSDNGQPLYYSTQFMTESYAEFILKKGNPLFIAEIVRENSQIYPRPVPLDFFLDDPFNFSMKQIGDFMDSTNMTPELQDIRSVTSSTGKVFLYSSRSLDRDHAQALAEWYDLGESSNP